MLTGLNIAHTDCPVETMQRRTMWVSDWTPDKTFFWKKIKKSRVCVALKTICSYCKIGKYHTWLSTCLSAFNRTTLVFKEHFAAFPLTFFTLLWSKSTAQHKLQKLISRMSVISLSYFKEADVVYIFLMFLVMCNDI